MLERMIGWFEILANKSGRGCGVSQNVQRTDETSLLKPEERGGDIELGQDKWLKVISGLSGFNVFAV